MVASITVGRLLFTKLVSRVLAITVCLPTFVLAYVLESRPLDGVSFESVYREPAGLLLLELE